MLELTQEQWDDLDWASNVLCGDADPSENRFAACNIAETLSVSGTTKTIRDAASAVLSQKVALAA